MRRIFTILLASILLMAFVIPCFAIEADTPNVSPRYTHINNNQVSLTINETTGIATCCVSCYAPGNYIVKVECKLQRYQGGFYSTIKTWTDSNAEVAGVHTTWAVNSGYTYRVYADLYVYDAAGNELEHVTSSSSYNYPKK